MVFRAVAFILSIPVAAFSAEQDALAISAQIQAHHAPFGAILDPVFESPSSEKIAGYTRCGDSAIWTGHYLAAEAYRYKVTGNVDALSNARRALDALRLLVDVTGTDLLARCAVPVEWEFAPGILGEEQQHGSTVGTVGGGQYYWIGHTSRDQYSGVFFGLAAAYDLIEDQGIRSEVTALITRMTEFLRRNQWNVRMPDGSFSTMFALRPDQQLAILQVARHINPDRFSSPYKAAAFFGALLVRLPVAIDVTDVNDSYFKFNLDTVNLFNLVRWETSGSRRSLYEAAYSTLRKTTDNHGNAHFNMIDRALRGPDVARDAETVALLNAWLKRPRRDVRVDLRGRVPACGNDIACAPIPVEQRVTTDFLWQRSPFQLYGGGDGFIENAGVDYILPYWMARYYNLAVD